MRTKTITTLIITALLFYSCGGGNNRQQQAASDTPQPVFRGFSESRVSEEQSTTCNEQQTAETDSPRATNVERAARNTQQEIAPDSIFSFAHTIPQLTGGNQNVSGLLNPENLTLEQTNSRVVFSSFIVEIDGSITDIRMQGAVMETVGGSWRSIGTVDISQSVINEMTERIQSLPKWIPAQYHGRAVRSRFGTSIPFHLE